MRRLMLLFTLMFATMSHAAEDRVIARVGQRAVMYGQVFCDRAYAAQNPQWLKGHSVEDACRIAEQEEFVRVLSRELLEAACKLHQCEPSDAEIDPFRSAVLKDEATLKRLVAEARVVPEAIRRVYRGEALEAVYEQVIKPKGHSIEQFRAEVRKFGSLEVVEKFLARDFAASARRQYEAQARYRALRSRMRKDLEAAAAANKQSVEEAADALLQSITAKVGLTVVDPQFHIPPGREIFL